MSIRPYPAIIRPSFHFRFLTQPRCVNVCIYGTYGLRSRASLPISKKYPAIKKWKVRSGEWRENFSLSAPYLPLPCSYPAKSGRNPAICDNAIVARETRRKRCLRSTLRSTTLTSVDSLAIYPATQREVNNVRKCPQVTKVRSRALSLSIGLEAIYDLQHACNYLIELSDRMSANVRNIEWGVKSGKWKAKLIRSSLPTTHFPLPTSHSPRCS